MKKISRFLLFLLIVPLCISFSACKKKGGNTDDSNQDQIEQPNPDSGGENDDETQYPDTITYYSVAFDYNLPEDYDFLLAGKDFSINYKPVGSTTALAKVPDVKLQQYFLGWCEEGSSEILSGSIKSDESKTIKLKGKWDEASLRKYYYSDGLSFDVVDGNACVFAYSGSSETIIIPEVFIYDDVEYDLTWIQTSVFEGKNIENVILNASNVNIGEKAFKDTAISDFDFSKVKTVGKYAFENTNFTTLNLDDGISSFKLGAFQNCTALVQVDFAENNVEIADYMFYGCSKLNSVENALNITKIGEYAFAECVSLQNTNFIGPRVKTMAKFAFQNCTGLISATLPETLTTLYIDVFDGCTQITELRLGQTFEDTDNTTRSDNLLAHIGDIGENVTKITLIGDSIQRLSRNYFDGFTKLETFIMSDSVTLVEPYTFRECAKLINITLSDYLDADTFNYMAFYGTRFLNEMTTPLIYANQIMYVPSNIVAEYTFPSDVNITRINSSAFSGNTSLKKITIPATVTSIGSSVFQSCTNLETVIFEENSAITEIPANTFYGCSKLKNINLSALTSLATLGDYSFRGTAITDFIIPSTITEMGDSVFLYSSIETFSIDGDSTAFAVEDGVLYELEESRKILINYPIHKQDELFVCPNDVTSIAPYAFSNVIYLKYVYFTNEIEWIAIELSGNNYFKSFDSASNLKLFSEDESFDTTEIIEIYRLCEDGVTYDFETGELSLSDDFSCDSNYVYIKQYNSNTLKIELICFEVVISEEDDEVSYTLKEDSIFIVETEF